MKNLIFGIFFTLICAPRLINISYAHHRLITYDLAVKTKVIRFMPDSNLFHFYFSVINNGTKTASGFDLFLYLDKNCDSIITADDELIWKETINDSVNYRDSLSRTLTWNNKVTGYQQLIFYIDFKSDLKLNNNIGFVDIFNPYPGQSIVVNEIMYGPLPDQSEYIELYNTSRNRIDLFKWRIGDQRQTDGSRNELLIPKHLVIEPGSFLVLSSDSSLLKLFPYLKEIGYSFFSLNRSSLNLNNDRDDIVLFDFNKNIIDSLRYYSTWQNPNVSDPIGISLERINYFINSNINSNWSSCANKTGGSPGKINSISLQLPAGLSKIEISPNPFSPDIDGFEDYTIIKYNIPLKFSKLRARIYDSYGRMVRTLVNNEFTISNGEIIWDGLDDSRQKLRIGIYILLFEALDDSNGKVEVIKSAIVLAGKL